MTTTVLGIDPGLGQSRPGFGTGIVVLERKARWSCLASELLEARTDQSTDASIASSTADQVAYLARFWVVDLVCIEWIEYQGASRAKQLTRLGPLVGAIRHACSQALDDGRIITPTRNQVLTHLGSRSSQQADRMVRRLVNGPAQLQTDHEVCAAAVAIVGYSRWRAVPELRPGRHRLPGQRVVILS